MTADVNDDSASNGRMDLPARSEGGPSLDPRPTFEFDAAGNVRTIIPAGSTCGGWDLICKHRYRDRRVAEYEGNVPQLVEWAEHAAKDPHSVGPLGLTGPPGSGKTAAAWAALHHLWKAGHTVGGWRLSVLAEMVLARPPEIRLSAVHRLDALLIDDIASISLRPEHVSILDQIVDERYANALPLIWTSNATPTELGTKLGEGCYERLMDQATLLTVLGQWRVGPDGRELGK